MATPARVVLCTVPDADVGARLARTLVEEQLAACVNMLPGVRSFYCWEGEAKDDPELLLIIKTVDARFAALRDRLSELHPYDVPEIIAMDVSSGSSAYLDWLGSAAAGS